MNPDSVYPDTRPRSQRTRSMTKMVQSMVSPSFPGRSRAAPRRGYSENRARGVECSEHVAGGTVVLRPHVLSIRELGLAAPQRVTGGQETETGDRDQPVRGPR